MTTRIGSKYYIQSDGAGLRSRSYPSKGKRKGNIPSGTESTQGSGIYKKQVPEMPIISEPELELSMSNSNRYKSHAEGSDRHINEPVKAVLHNHSGKSDEARMNLEYDIKSEIGLITEKMDKINEDNLNMPKLSTPFSNIRSPVGAKEEMKDPFITDLSHQDNNKVLMKEVPQLKHWQTFTGEGKYDHMSFTKTIDMFKEDYAISDELITARLH
ncbi:hypothetical protein O181_010109 [Austropuccinia psidii MF-1]|uniref:Uncharacterized protein n=1 Tax=Austropuccinia psidii MF-1 TaxID=1389203 RepID=A0A9Q3GKI4_9BASI|nr:hypothetical protein [Austropuccinia psidii MF-1]